MIHDFLSVYKTKNGLVAKINPLTVKNMFPKSKIKSKKTKIDLKPIDTSNWVKPDEESIKNELVGHLFLEEIYKKDTENWNRANEVVNVLFGILNSTSPKNPQYIMNYGRCEHPIETALNLFKKPEEKTHFGKTMKTHLYNIKNKIHKTDEERKENYKNYVKKLTKTIKVIK